MTTDQVFMAGARWATALRELTPHDDICLISHGGTLTAPGFSKGDQSDELALIAIRSNQDIVHITVNRDTREPVRVALLVRDAGTTVWFSTVRPWAASENAPVGFLTASRLWAFGPSHTLVANRLPPISSHGKGEAIAMRRWRQRVSATADVVTLGAASVAKDQRNFVAKSMKDINRAN